VHFDYLVTFKTKAPQELLSFCSGCGTVSHIHLDMWTPLCLMNDLNEMEKKTIKVEKSSHVFMFSSFMFHAIPTSLYICFALPQWIQV